MVAKTDLIFGDLITRLGLVTLEQAKECLEIQKTRPSQGSLGSIMVEKGYLTPEQLQIAVNIQKHNLEARAIQHRRIKEDYIFGRLVLKLGLATEARVEECLGMQMMQDDYFLRVSEIMLKKGYLTQEQVQQVLDYQALQVITCSDCKTKYNVVLFTPDTKFFCYKCNRELTAPSLPSY